MNQLSAYSGVGVLNTALKDPELEETRVIPKNVLKTGDTFVVRL